MKRTQAQLAELLGVSRQTVSAWKRQGADLDDLDAMRVLAAGVLAKQSGAEGYLEARTRRTRAQADRSETLAARERGELVELAGIAAQGESTGRAFRQTLDRLANNLPPMLAGRAAGEIVKILKTEFRLALEKLRDTPNDQFLKIP